MDDKSLSFSSVRFIQRLANSFPPTELYVRIGQPILSRILILRRSCESRLHLALFEKMIDLRITNIIEFWMTPTRKDLIWLDGFDDFNY